MTPHDLMAYELSLDRLELLIVDLPQHEPFRSAIGWRHSRQVLFVRWIDRQGREGIGECSCRPDPYFSHEFLSGALAVIDEILFPNLASQGTYGELLGQLNRIRGWQFAKAAVLESVHDLMRRQGDADPLDRWQTARVEDVPVGISLGLYETASELVQKLDASLALGYRRIKMKIRPGLDPGYLAEARAAFPDAYLGCDANGTFNEHTMEELVALADLNLAMIEQPFAPDRIDLCAELKQRAPLRICLDESVYCRGHLRTAVALGAIDELNIKPGRVGGILNAIEMARFCGEAQIPVWVGGMFETGIGRAANLRFAACFPQAQGHDLSPSKRYFVEDLVCDPVDMNEQGYIRCPHEPVRVHWPNIEKYLMKCIVKRKNHA